MQRIEESHLHIAYLQRILNNDHSLMLGQIYAMLQVPQAVATMVFSLTTNKYILLLLINIFLFYLESTNVMFPLKLYNVLVK